MTRVTNDQEASMKPLALRLRAWGLDRIAKYMVSGQLDKRAALMALEMDESYYLAPVDEAGAAGAWRKMAAILGDRNRPAAETAYVTASFCDDVLNAGWDESALDRAASAWRGAGERFVPTFGQLAKVASEAKIISGRFHLQAMRRAIDPPRIAGNLAAPKPRDKAGDAGMDKAQTLAAIAKAEGEKAANRIERDGKPTREWGRFDEMALNGLRARRDAFAAEAAS